MPKKLDNGDGIRHLVQPKKKKNKRHGHIKRKVYEFSRSSTILFGTIPYSKVSIFKVYVNDLIRIY